MPDIWIIQTHFLGTPHQEPARLAISEDPFHLMNIPSHTFLCWLISKESIQYNYSWTVRRDFSIIHITVNLHPPSLICLCVCLDRRAALRPFVLSVNSCYSIGICHGLYLFAYVWTKIHMRSCMTCIETSLSTFFWGGAPNLVLFKGAIEWKTVFTLA